MSHYKRTTCRICGGGELHEFLSLGPTPLANAFPRSPEEFADEPAYPLDVYLCGDCGLVQLLDVIDPETLFRDYVYLAGTSDAVSVHNRDYAGTVTELLEMGSGDLVVEVGSNDGGLLRCFADHGVRTLGVEPASNIAAIAREAGIETLGEFFTTDAARAARRSHGPAKAVIGNNVLAHVDEVLDFLGGFGALLTDTGLAIAEVPSLEALLDRLAYDTIYHEHLCYFSLTSLLRLCEAVDLRVVRIDRVATHGGSLRLYAGRRGAYPEHAPEVLDLASEERERGVRDLPRLQRFASAVAENRKALRGLLLDLRRDGRTVAAYGAPAKGNTLLNYCGIDGSLIEYVVDKSPLKIGRFTPGTHLPVLPPATLLERQPDYLLILAWNFADEIIGQQREYAARGGKFLIPIPEPHLV